MNPLLALRNKGAVKPTSDLNLSSPLGFHSNYFSGYWPPTHIESYGLVTAYGTPSVGFNGVHLRYMTGVTAGNGENNVSSSVALANNWVLRDASNNPIKRPDNVQYVCDPGILAYQNAFWNLAVTRMAATGNANGIWVDDFTPTLSAVTAGGIWPPAYPNMAAYKVALLSFANRIRTLANAAGKVVAYNTSVTSDNLAAATIPWFRDEIGPIADILTREWWMGDAGPVPGDKRRRAGTEWYNGWDQWRSLHSICNSVGCKFLPLDYDEAHDYGLGTFLLDWNGTDGYQVRVFHAGNSDPWSTFGGQALALGAPTAAATQISANVWQRQFQNGLISVNANTAVATITLT